MTKSHITYVRLTDEQRKRLERIAAGSITDNLSDHIRAAVDDYIDKNEERMAKEEPVNAQGNPPN